MIQVTTLHRMDHLRCMPRHPCCSVRRGCSLGRMQLVRNSSLYLISCSDFFSDNAICQTPSFQARFGILDTLLQRCLNAAIMMASECQPHTAEQKQALVAIHLIALAYVTHHRPFILTYCPSARRCVDATFGVVRLLDRMRELGTSVGCVSPLYAVRLLFSLPARGQD